ncbi:MAG: hypothetical protein ACHP84_05780 [Caulobacterales bacterium]
MSLLSEIRAGGTTLENGLKKIEAWGESILAKAPASVQAAVRGAVADVKHAASDAVTVADTLAGPLISGAADTIGTAFATAASAYLGPFGSVVTPAALDAIDRIRDGIKAELDTLALELKAQLAGAAPGQTSTSTPAAGG